jgi:hypothetical protein
VTEHSHGPADGGVRFEAQDVEPRAIVRFALILAAVSIGVAVLLVFLLRYYHILELDTDPPPAPMAQMEPGRLPPEPRLQRVPFDDIETMRAEETQILERYGWVDQKAGVVHIPIEQAMEKLLHQGLPARPAEAAKK